MRKPHKAVDVEYRLLRFLDGKSGFNFQLNHSIASLFEI